MKKNIILYLLCNVKIRYKILIILHRNFTYQIYKKGVADRFNYASTTKNTTIHTSFIKKK